MGVGFLRAAVSVALLATSCACAHAQTGEISGGTVKIGVLTDMTGVFSDLAGGGAVTAAQMAIDDFVESERPSFKIEPVSVYHQNKPDIATGIARQWYDTSTSMTDAATWTENCSAPIAAPLVSNADASNAEAHKFLVMTVWQTPT